MPPRATTPPLRHLSEEVAAGGGWDRSCEGKGQEDRAKGQEDGAVSLILAARPFPSGTR